MTARSVAPRRPFLGLAVSTDGVTAAGSDGVIHRVPLDGTLDPATARETLGRAFSQLAGLTPDYAGLRVAVAVMPPLAEARSLELPPVSPEEAEAIVRRNPAAHFLMGGGPVLVGVQRLGLGEGGGGLFGAAVPRFLADAIHEAASEAGFELTELVPAHAAWIAALNREDGPDAEAFVALVGGTAHVMSPGRGGEMVHRRVPASDNETVVGVLGTAPGRIAVAGPTADRDAVRSALAGAGLDALDAGQDAEEIAAGFAGASGIEFVPPRLAMERRDRSRRTLVRMLAGAALLLVAAGTVQLWGANRSLERVREWRAEIRDDVAPLLAVSDSIARFEDSRARVEALERAASGWTVPLVELSVLLPEDAHLEGLQVVGDTLLVDAVADRAGAVVDALQGATALDELRIEGSIRREVVSGETRNERFRLRAVRGSEWSNEDGASDGGRM